MVDSLDDGLKTRYRLLVYVRRVDGQPDPGQSNCLHKLIVLKTKRLGNKGSVEMLFLEHWIRNLATVFLSRDRETKGNSQDSKKTPFGASGVVKWYPIHHLR